MKSRGWGTRHPKPRPRSKWALLTLALRIAAVAAAGVVALPAPARAQDPGTERSGQVWGNPGYTWDVIVDTAGNDIVTIIGPGSDGNQKVWASFGGGPWRVTNQYSSLGIWTVVSDPSTLPSFLGNPDDPNYPMFIEQLLPPEPLPDLFPPPGTPPTLDQGDPGDDPGYYSGTDNSGPDDIGDMYWGSDPGPDTRCDPGMDCSLS